MLTYSVTSIFFQYSKAYNQYFFKKEIFTGFTICVKPIFLTNNKRTMLNGKTLYITRAAYHCLKALINPNVMDETTTSNNKPLGQSIVDLAMDPQKGTPQHKTTLFKHITNQRINVDDVYLPFYEHIQNTLPGAESLVKWDPHVQVDARVMNELPVFKEYLLRYSKDIAWTLATNDSRSANFTHQKQSNPDFWVYLDRGFGLTGKCVYQDEKSGMDIVRHTTRGSIGLLSYDADNNNIQVTNNPISIQDLIIYNKRRMVNLQNALVIDKTHQELKTPIVNMKQICDTMDKNSFEDFSKLHNELENILWKEFQCNPVFTRSISFIFLKQIINTPMTEEERVFSNKFLSYTEPKMYDLNKSQDFKNLYKAMIFAGKEIDSQLITKLQYLHYHGVTLNGNFLSLMTELIKHGL